MVMKEEPLSSPSGRLPPHLCMYLRAGSSSIICILLYHYKVVVSRSHRLLI